MKMKRLSSFIGILFAALYLSACSGDHSVHNGQDTAKDSQVQSGVDTSRTTTTTGDASNIDNSGSGGTRIAKDSSNLKADSIKK